MVSFACVTPYDVHYGLAAARVAARAETLAAAHAVYPGRFPRGVPQPPGASDGRLDQPTQAASDRGGAPTLNL